MAASAAPPYQIRLSGTPPAPPPSASTGGKGKGGGRGGKKKKSAPAAAAKQQPQQRHTVTVTASLTVPQLKLDASRLFGVGLEYDVEFLVGYPPKPLDLGAVTGGEDSGGEGALVKDVVGRNESVIVRFVEAAASGAGSGGCTSTAGGGNRKIDGKAKAGGANGNAVNGKGGKKRSRPAASAAAAAASDGDSSDEHDDAEAGAAAASAGGSRRSKRAASAAATASMPDLVRAQEKLMAATGSKAAKKKSSSTTSSPNAAAAKRKAAAEARAAAAASRRLAALPGRRLADGAAVGPAPSASSTSSSTSRAKKTTSKSIFGNMSSEDDVSYQLMSSLNSGSGGGGGGKVGRVLRSAMRNAVGKTYEASRAVVRVDAVRSGKFRIVPKAADASTGGRLGSSSAADSESSSRSLLSGMHTVKYSKGVEGRGEYEEDVEIIALEALRAVVTAVHSDHSADDSAGETDGGGGGGGGGREMLRPPSMAQLSPRVFWSLAHHYPGKDTESALRAMLPDLDWTFLDGRSRMLSEKAKENLRQERVARGEIPDDDDDYDGLNGGAGGDGAAGVGAVEAVERAMMDEAGSGRDSAREARERAARAAMARFGGDATSSSAAASAAVGAESREEEPKWRLVTPTEVDEDELTECIREGIAELGLDAVPSDPEVESWVATLINSCSIHNWRELANSSAPIVLAGFASAAATTSVPTEAQIESILDAARLQSIDEIMLSILDSPNYSAEDVYVILREEARCGTPKDVICWEPIPGMLLEEAEGLAEAGVGVEDVKRWCGRTRDVLEFWLWLDWYATPVA